MFEKPPMSWPSDMYCRGIFSFFGGGGVGWWGGGLGVGSGGGGV